MTTSDVKGGGFDTIFGSQHRPYVGELGRVVVPVDEAQEDLQDQQPYLRILVEREGQQRLQEGAGQRRQHVGGLETCCHLAAQFQGFNKRRGKKRESGDISGNKNSPTQSTVDSRSFISCTG